MRAPPGDRRVVEPVAGEDLRHAETVGNYDHAETATTAPPRPPRRPRPRRPPRRRDADAHRPPRRRPRRPRRRRHQRQPPPRRRRRRQRRRQPRRPAPRSGDRLDGGDHRPGQLVRRGHAAAAEPRPRAGDPVGADRLGDRRQRAGCHDQLQATPASVGTPVFSFGCGSDDGTFVVRPGRGGRDLRRSGNSRPQFTVPVTAATVTSVSLTATGSAANLPTDPAASASLSISTSPARPRPPGTSPRPCRPGRPHSAASPAGSAAGLFPTLEPSSPPPLTDGTRQVASTSALPAGDGPPHRAGGRAGRPLRGLRPRGHPRVVPPPRCACRTRSRRRGRSPAGGACRAG